MIKPIVYAWITFRREGFRYKGSHRFFCKKHRKMLNGAHCYCCYMSNLKGTNALSRPLCKAENGISPKPDYTKRLRMKKKDFIKLIKKYRKEAKKALRSNKR